MFSAIIGLVSGVERVVSVLSCHEAKLTLLQDDECKTRNDIKDFATNKTQHNISKPITK